MTVHRSPARHAGVDLHQLYSHGPRALRRRWVLATTIGEAAGFLVPALVAVAVFDLHPALVLVLMTLAGVGEGLLLGTAQALVLGREFLGFDRRAWAGATAVGAGAAWALGMLPSTLSDTWAGWPPYVTVPLGVVLGLALLGCIGFAQWTVLRHHVARARTWVPANAVAWALGLGVLLGIATPLWREAQPTALVVAIAAAGGLAMALTVALVTGSWLARLVAPRHGGAMVRRTPVGVPQSEWTRLAEPTDSFQVFDPVPLEDLPDPVQRWLRHVVTPGAALLTGVEAEWSGHLHLGRSWHKFCSRQRATLDGGFVWAARTRLLGLPVTGFDRFGRGEAELRWRLLRILRLVGETGDEATRSSAGRHAAELLASVPAVALDPSVRWEPLDHSRATAHLVVAGQEQAVTVTVDALGRLRQVEMERWGAPAGASFGLHRFGALLSEERRFDGYLVPTEMVVGWHIGTDRWEDGVFLRCRVLRCSFH